jgi:hypothetical protein
MSYTKQTTSTAPASKNGPMLPSEVDFSKFAYSELKQMGNGPAKTCYVNYNGGKLVIETPWMTTPFGIRQPPIEFRDEGAAPKYSIEFTLKGYEGEDPAVQALYDFMQKLQEKFLEDSCTHAMDWHRKKTMSKDVAEALFTPLIRRSKDKATGEFTDVYAPTFKAKVQCYEGEWKAKVIQKGSRDYLEGDLSEQVNGRMNARAILECSSLWFAGGKFGASWKLVMMEYESSDQQTNTAFAFRDPTPIAEPVALSLSKVDEPTPTTVSPKAVAEKLADVTISQEDEEEDGDIVEDSDEEVVE